MVFQILASEIFKIVILTATTLFWHLVRFQ